jgi:hypothetical protein
LLGDTKPKVAISLAVTFASWLALFAARIGHDYGTGKLHYPSVRLAVYFAVPVVVVALVFVAFSRIGSE